MLRLNDKQMPYRRLLSCDATLPYAADCSKQYIRHDFLKYLLCSLSAHMANITHYRTISDKLLFCSLTTICAVCLFIPTLSNAKL